MEVKAINQTDLTCNWHCTFTGYQHYCTGVISNDLYICTLPNTSFYGCCIAVFKHLFSQMHNVTAHEWDSLAAAAAQCFLAQSIPR